MELKEFNDFFTEYQQRFVHFATTYLHDEVVAEDLVVDSMMYYWENRNRLSNNTNAPAYVLTTLKHKCIDYLRHQKLVQDSNKEIGELQRWDMAFRLNSMANFEPENIFTHEIQEIVEKTLESLPERTRLIFRECRLENKSYKEVAEMYGISIKGVEFHITKSNKALRKALDSYLPLWLLWVLFP